MNINEAYQKVMDAVLELKNMGVEVAIRPSRSKSNASEKYVGEEFLSVDKWVHVEFRPKNQTEYAFVSDYKKHLNWAGITFDSGGMGNCRDWEIDWSLRANDGPDGEAQDRQEAVEEIMRQASAVSCESTIGEDPGSKIIRSAFEVLKSAMSEYPDYARGWHDNIAVCAQDAGLEYNASQKAAAAFMKLCFGVDTAKKS
jgi:hypothetical protein